MNQKPQKNLKIGELGEKAVSQWLINQGWKILASRWRCRWGEIDLIAQNHTNLIAFIEVKTRNKLNLDHQGIEAITSTKQLKIIKSAELFLTENPQFNDYILRFDVALVTYQNRDQPSSFSVIKYLESAFEIDD